MTSVGAGPQTPRQIAARVFNRLDTCTDRSATVPPCGCVCIKLREPGRETPESFNRPDFAFRISFELRRLQGLLITRAHAGHFAPTPTACSQLSARVKGRCRRAEQQSAACKKSTRAMQSIPPRSQRARRASRALSRKWQAPPQHGGTSAEAPKHACSTSARDASKRDSRPWQRTAPRVRAARGPAWATKCAPCMSCPS